MDGYHLDGNQDEDFNAAGFGNYSGYANDTSFGNHSGGGETRDFLSQPAAYSPMLGVPSSSNPSGSQLRLDSLDLNAGQSWANMDTYQGILQSGPQEGGSGSFDPPPLRVPSRSGRGSLGLRPPRSGAVGGGTPTPRGDSGSSGAGRVPPRQRGSTSGDAGGSRSRGARRRLEQAAVDDNMPPPQVPHKLDRAQWSDYHTKVFCQLYCDQIDIGYCNRGQMTKWGWQNITEEYFKRTKLVHDNVIFGNKVRALKKEWRAIRDLQIKETGLGRSADGSINASDQWWEENSKDHQKELKDGLPEYLPEMDKMFEGVCVTGETSYVPGRRNGPHNISSEEDEDGGDTTPHSTPHSTGSKRSFSSISTRSTGTSPSKKSRSPAVHAMQSNMRDLNLILENRTAAQNQIWADRQKREEQLEENKRARRKRVREMARQLGVAGDSRLWVGVLKLVRSEEDMESFEEADEDGRKCILVHLSGEAEQPAAAVDADADRKQQWEQDFFAMLAEEDHEEIALIYGTCCCREVLCGGLWVPQPSRLPGSVQGNHVPYSRLPKRRRTTRLSGLDDNDFGLVDQHVHYVPPEASIDQPETVDAPDLEDVAQMNAFRDYIAEHLYNRS